MANALLFASFKKTFSTKSYKDVLYWFLKNLWSSTFCLCYFNWFRIEFCVGKKSGWDVAWKSVINNFSHKFSSSKLPGSNFTILSSKSVRSDFIFYVMLGCPVSMYHISMIPCINHCPNWLLVPSCHIHFLVYFSLIYLSVQYSTAVIITAF